jgi:acetyl-CoA carboxylase biotin carboxyl carrier protein
MALSDEDVREILRLIDESKVDELRIETAELKLHVRRGAAPQAEVATERSARPPAPEPDPATAGAASESPTGPRAPEPATAAPGPGAASNRARTIDAPMLGTFYRAEAPGADPFVDVGTEVDPDTVVCLIEVMKMMNSIQAGVAGRIVEVCAENAQLVEFGDALFRVEPAA